MEDMLDHIDAFLSCDEVLVVAEDVVRGFVVAVDLPLVVARLTLAAVKIPVVVVVVVVVTVAVAGG